MHLSAWVVSIATLSFILAAIPSTASHAVNKMSDMTLEDKGRSSSYYVTLQGCIEHNMNSTISASSQNYSPTSINWFDDNNAYGYVYPDGKRDCKDIMKSALELWGITADDFLTGIKYSQKSKTSYNWSGTDNDSTRKSNFESYIKTALGTSEPNNPGAAAAYLRYKKWWGDKCVEKKFGKYDDITDPVLKKRIDDNYTESISSTSTSADGVTSTNSVIGMYVKIPLVNNVEWAYLYKTKNSSSAGVVSTDSVYTYIAYGYHTNPRKISCDDTKNNLEKFASSYSSYLDEAAVETICKSKGYKNISANPYGEYTLNACIAGYNSVPGYCATTYKPITMTYYGTVVTNSQEKEKAACEAGQGITPAELASAREGVLATEQTSAGEAVGEGKTSCVIEAVGWIVCPVVNFLAGVSDGAFIFLANSFLNVGPQAFNTDQPIYTAWTVMRNIANVLFVIVFLIIIFSQLTGSGVSNYGVKKMLPRLVIAAVLVNVSFFISQIAIDISNILGYSIRDVFNAITTSAVKTESIQDIVNEGSPIANGSGFIGIAGGILASGIAGVALYALLSTLIPILLAAVVALVMILFILVARQAIVILLVVLSPIAFVALLLPNTERLFKMWRKMLTAMLLLFPIVALIFGASSFASVILTSTFTGGNQVIPGDSSNWFGQLIGAAVLVLPLFVVPTVLKKSLDGVPMLGQLASKWSDRATKGARSGAANSGVMKSLAHRRQTKRAQIGAGIYSGRNPISKVRSAINGGLNRSSAFNAMTGGYGTVRGASIEKLESEETKMAEAAVQLEARSGATVDQQLARAIQKGDIVAARAAQNILMRRGGSGVKSARDTMSAHDATMSREMRSMLSNNILENHAKAAKDSSADVLKWAQSGLSATPKAMEDLAKDAGTWSGMSARELAGQTDEAFARAMHSGGVSAETVAALNSDRMREGLTDSQRTSLLAHVAPAVPGANRPATSEYSREQIQQMGVENAQKIIDSKGIDNLSDGDVLRIANVHGGTATGTAARQEATQRNLRVNPQSKPRDPSTMPNNQPPTQPPAP